MLLLHSARAMQERLEEQHDTVREKRPRRGPAAGAGRAKHSSKVDCGRSLSVSLSFSPQSLPTSGHHEHSDGAISLFSAGCQAQQSTRTRPRCRCLEVAASVGLGGLPSQQRPRQALPQLRIRTSRSCSRRQMASRAWHSRRSPISSLPAAGTTM